MTGPDHIAESYVKLVLAVGNHDADYVDAYYGPPEFKNEPKMSLPAIAESANGLIRELRSVGTDRLPELELLRHRYLLKQLESLAARVRQLGGEKKTFDEEAAALYDAEPPSFPEDHFKSVLNELSALLPPGRAGETVSTRFESFKRDFIIPKEKLDAVFQTAISECRERTKKHIELAPNENFIVEYVTNKSWSGYNWYKGNNFSLIQVNTDLPIYIDRAVDLAAHEGYPGHHVYNSLLESHMYRKRGWVEFSVYALFSPQSLIAEGTANYGIEVAFPGKDRIAFESEVLFPAAGMNASKADLYYRIHDLFGKLAYAGNESARKYLNGTISRSQAAEWLVTYALMSPERAEQRTRFFDSYRSYVINYNLGQDLVRNYIVRRGGTPDRPGKRWEEFKLLISSPRLPSGLR